MRQLTEKEKGILVYFIELIECDLEENFKILRKIFYETKYIETIDGFGVSYYLKIYFRIKKRDAKKLKFWPKSKLRYKMDWKTKYKTAIFRDEIVGDAWVEKAEIIERRHIYFRSTKYRGRKRIMSFINILEIICRLDPIVLVKIEQELFDYKG